MLNNLASPYGLAAISYAFFLFACFIPPSIYTRCMHEPDLMFLDPATILFYTLCVAGFVAGVWFFESLFPPTTIVERKFETTIHPAVFLAIPLLLATALSLLSSFLLVKNNPAAIALLLAQQAGELRAEDGTGLALEGTMNSSVLFLTGVVWWAAWRYHQSGVHRRGGRAVKLILCLAVLAVLIASILRASRHYVTVAITGLALFYVLRKVFDGQLNWKVVGKTILVLALGGTLFFLLIGALRQDIEGGSQIDALAGYTIASYNRLAALLAGRLHYEFAGRGIYLSNLLLFNHAFNQIIPIGHLMNVPDYFDWWASEFASVSAAGLNSAMIFCGMFGEIYNEIGWFAPLYLFGYGLLYGLIWRWMREGRLAGILLYPYFAYLILFWFTTNGVFEAHTAALLGCSAMLGIYELRFARRSERFVPSLQAG